MIVLVGLVALAQPGLCPCWLIADVREYHPHPDGRPQQPHDHDYLFDMFHAQTAVALVVWLAPASALLVLWALGSLWRLIAGHSLPGQSWSTSPLTPPPRARQ